MPLITRRSSTRGVTRVSFGSGGSIFANCSSVSQKQSRFIALSSENVNHETARLAKPFMGPDPSVHGGRQGWCSQMSNVLLQIFVITLGFVGPAMAQERI